MLTLPVSPTSILHPRKQTGREGASVFPTGLAYFHTVVPPPFFVPKLYKTPESTHGDLTLIYVYTVGFLMVPTPFPSEKKKRF